jgi:mono/diheme cytochrome c family protein
LVALGVMAMGMAPRGQPSTSPGADRTATSGAGRSLPVAKASASQEVSQGEALFGQKCAPCHAIGGDGRPGPDLKGVVDQRPRDWLIQIIVAPETPIEEGDALTARLVDEYAMLMPNLGVSRAEAEQVLAYLQFQSSPSAVAAATAPAASSKAAAPEVAGAVASARQAGPAAAPPAQGSSQSQALFDQKCASCHTLGGGRTVGPDLKGVADNRQRDWLIEFIVNPGQVHARNDPIAVGLQKEYGMAMPNVGVTGAQAEEMLALLSAQPGGASAPAAAAVRAPLPQGDATRGRALFTGQRALAGGGPACAACHNAAGAGLLGGGTWGLDLTHTQSRVGEAGLVALVKSPAFPGMKEAYLASPVADQEAADLAAFFAALEGQQGNANDTLLFLALGLIAFGILAGVAQLVWRGRSGSVRQQLVRSE